MSLISFITKKGLNRTSEEIAVDLIYAATRLYFPISKITFGKALELDQRPDLDYDPNAAAWASINNEYDTRYTKASGFLYQRLPLSLITKDKDVFFNDIPYPFKTHDVLDAINEALNTKLSTNDVINDKHTDPYESFVLRAHPESLVWYDDVVLVQVTELPSGRILETGEFRVLEDSVGRTVVLE